MNSSKFALILNLLNTDSIPREDFKNIINNLAIFLELSKEVDKTKFNQIDLNDPYRIDSRITRGVFT